MSNYQEKLILIIGVNGTGKTTVEAELVNHFLSKNHRALIVTPNPDEWTQYPDVKSDAKSLSSFVKAARILANPFNNDTIVTDLYTGYKNGLLVLDDMRVFVDNRVDKFLEAILIDRRHRNVDILAVAHSFETMPKSFYRYANTIILFKTSGKINDRKKELVNPEAFEAAQIRVNEKAETDPYYYEIINL